MNHLSGTSLQKNGIRIFGPKRAWNILLKTWAAQDPKSQLYEAPSRHPRELTPGPHGKIKPYQGELIGSG